MMDRRRRRKYGGRTGTTKVLLLLMVVVAAVIIVVVHIVVRTSQYDRSSRRWIIQNEKCWWIFSMDTIYVSYISNIHNKDNNKNNTNNNSTTTTTTTTTTVPGFYVLDPQRFQHFLGEDYNWAITNIPFIDLPSSSSSLTDIVIAYYYRWKSYKKHIVYIDDNDHFVGYVVTEFLPNVPWAGKYNTIPAATGHHIMEGRWIHNSTILNDYIRFWISSHVASNPSSYTNWIGYATYQRYLLLNGNDEFIESLLDGLVDLYRNTYIPKYLRNVTTIVSSSSSHPQQHDDQQHQQQHDQQHCWYQMDGYDAMEVSISGSGCRPTIASVMYGEAEVITLLAQRSQNFTLQKEFEQWVEMSRSIVLKLHWNPMINSFAVIPIDDEEKGDDRNNDKDNSSTTHPSIIDPTTCDLNTVRIPNRPVNVRELLAFMPWYYETLIPPPNTKISQQQHKSYLSMWKELFVGDNDDDNDIIRGRGGGFAAKYGLRSVEHRHPCYNYSWDHGDCWNGPSWPFETSRVLTSFANILNNHHQFHHYHPPHHLEGEYDANETQSTYSTTTQTILQENGITVDNYFELLLQYAKQHTITYAVNDTAKPIGSGHIFENLHPDLGYWNNRQIMYDRNDTENKDMGDDYNHSTFCDLILSGLFGIRPQRDGKTIHINPLVPTNVIKTFAVDHVRIHGDNILSITWNDGSSNNNNIVDDDDNHEHQYPPGLTVFWNGKVAAHRPDMGLLKIHPYHDVSSSSS